MKNPIRYKHFLNVYTPEERPEFLYLERVESTSYLSAFIRKALKVVAGLESFLITITGRAQIFRGYQVLRDLILHIFSEQGLRGTFPGLYLKGKSVMDINIYDIEPIIQLSAKPCAGSVNQHVVEKLKSVFNQDLSINPTPARAVLINDQFVESRWAFVFDQQSNYVLQSAYLKPQTLINQILERDRASAVRLDDDYLYFMAYNHDYANYYHWTLQCFPSFCLYAALKNVYSNLRLLLPANLPGFALQYLELLDIDLEREVQFLPLQEKLFFAHQVIYPSFIGGEFAFNPSKVVFNFANIVAERLFKNEFIPGLLSRQQPRILYCSRLDSVNRRISNESSLIDFLVNKYGARIYANTGQTVTEQAKKFFESDIIIAPHGAGLSNILYCRPQTAIIELIPDKYVNPCFTTLAVHKGCRYYPYFFPTTSFTGHQHNYEWEVDINIIEAALESILNSTIVKWL